MSSVEAFYARLTEDEAFRAQVQSATSKEECSRIVKAAGYDFTQEELDTYNKKLLIDTGLDSSQLQELNEKEVAEVLGGFYGDGRYQLMYGGGWLPPEERMLPLPELMPPPRKWWWLL
jgi:predicted ribosomally synthesized peptide with nif11-like leader